MSRGPTLTRAELVAEVSRLATEGATGTLFVRTTDDHTARLVLQDGTLVGIAYRATRGVDAIPLLQNITGCTIEFTAGFVFPISATEKLPQTRDLLRRLSDPGAPTAEELAEDEARAAALENLLAEFIGAYASHVMQEITAGSQSSRLDWSAAIDRMATEVDAGQVDELIKRARKLVAS